MVMCESAVAATSHVAVLPRPHRSAAPARFSGGPRQTQRATCGRSFFRTSGMKMLAAKAGLAAGNGDVAASA